MTNGSTTPVQRLQEIPDVGIRTSSEQAVHTTLQAHFAHLRAIKDTELRWVDFLALVSLPAIGYLMTVDDGSPLWGWSLAWIVIGYLLLVLWIQYVLLGERLSYYAVLRSVVRSQNLLGLFDLQFLPKRFANSAFPKELGPCPDVDGTQPYASFLHRQIYAMILLFGVQGTAAFRNEGHAPHFALLAITLVLIDVAWLVILFRRDRLAMIRAWISERNLAGADPSWFPSPIIDQPPQAER